MRPGLRNALWGGLIVIGAAGLIVAVRHEQAGTAPPRRPSPLAAGSKLARPEGELGELKRRLKVRREQSIRELRSLIRQLEKQAEDQRARLHEEQTQLSEVEADLDRAQALLRHLEENAPRNDEVPSPSDGTPLPSP